MRRLHAVPRVFSLRFKLSTMDKTEEMME